MQILKKMSRKKNKNKTWQKAKSLKNKDNKIHALKRVDRDEKLNTLQIFYEKIAQEQAKNREHEMVVFGDTNFNHNQYQNQMENIKESLPNNLPDNPKIDSNTHYLGYQNNFLPHDSYQNLVRKNHTQQNHQNYEHHRFLNTKYPQNYSYFQNIPRQTSQNKNPQPFADFSKTADFNPLSYFTKIMGTCLFLASLVFWFFIVQPSILEKITDQYTSKNSLLDNGKIQVLKNMEKIKLAINAGQTDIKNIKTLGCQNNNVELNIKKFEQEKYKILEQKEPVITVFSDENVWKIYQEYILKLNNLLDEELVNKNLSGLANNIQNLNNLTISCAKIVEKRANLADNDFINAVCSDLKNGLDRFGVVDNFGLNKICANNFSKLGFLADLDKFINTSADSILQKNESDIYQKVELIRQQTEVRINEYYNQKISFPKNIYLLKVKK